MYQINEGLEKEYKEYAEKNTDPYGGAVLAYAARWASMMEGRIENGETDIAAYADETSHEADTEGITGFMYGCAVNELAYFWVHGEELRKWHNADWGCADAKGVVNPAVFTISLPEE